RRLVICRESIGWPWRLPTGALLVACERRLGFGQLLAQHVHGSFQLQRPIAGMPHIGITGAHRLGFASPRLTEHFHFPRSQKGSSSPPLIKRRPAGHCVWILALTSMRSGENLHL